MTNTARLLLFICLSFFRFMQAQDLNTVLMQGTFRISGPSRTPGKLAYGSGFIVGRPINQMPGKEAYVFVTAAHVLANIAGPQITLMLRTQEADGKYKPLPIAYRIRDDFKTYYKVSSETDIAVAYIMLPSQVKPDLVGLENFSNDEGLKSMSLHPGDTLFSLGFPLYSDLNTFPVLRSGVLASYPITPMRAVSRFFMNFKVLPGNSGGPVYYDYTLRGMPDGTNLMGRWLGILGVVTEAISSDAEGESEPLDVAIVIPSLYVKDLINSLDEQPNPDKTLIPMGLRALR